MFLCSAPAFTSEENASDIEDRQIFPTNLAGNKTGSLLYLVNHPS
jgi:hypothetical protein